MTVDFAPTPLRVTDNIRAVVQSNPAVVAYAWYRNGELLADMAGDTLPRGQFQRGDSIQVRVTADAMRAEATSVVANSPPSVVTLPLADAGIQRGVDVTLVPEGTDPDGDPVSFSYLWIINGEEKSVETSATLAGDSFVKGDRIGVRIVPNDGFEDGAAYAPLEFVVPNAPPSIVSSPSQEIAGNSYVYQIKAVDPDGDLLTYSLANAPAGMTIDPAGKVLWVFTADSVGTHGIKVVVTDSDGASAEQSWDLTISIRMGEPQR